ncbi:unnamed protein product [Rangifer tarandus platyrhynchus]|uniref:Uncharacterized protein n=2 Tax=Rangifer tarandus platyrhynchus TaxID=3082113 RepID=A0ABN8Z2S6_RANTA|nr:unnamed protein product [Rangifer tarandus platyrhynchus]
MMTSSKERPLIFSIGIDLKIIATISEEQAPSSECALGQEDCVCSTIDCAAHPSPSALGVRVRHSMPVLTFRVSVRVCSWLHSHFCNQRPVNGLCMSFTVFQFVKTARSVVKTFLNTLKSNFFKINL